MSPEEAAAWIGENKEHLSRRRQFYCDCRKGKPIAVVWADAVGGMLLWMAGRTLTDQAGEAKRRAATAVRVDPDAPDTLHLATCPRCQRGQLIGIRGGQLEVVGLTGPPTRGRVVE